MVTACPDGGKQASTMPLRAKGAVLVSVQRCAHHPHCAAFLALHAATADLMLLMNNALDVWRRSGSRASSTGGTGCLKLEGLEFNGHAAL